MSKEADICLILEGAYPYVAGGVSSWMHDLIQGQPDLTFHVVALASSAKAQKMRYELPPNVIGFDTIPPQLPKGGHHSARKLDRMFEELGGPLTGLLQKGDIQDLSEVIRILGPERATLGSAALLESESAWGLIQQMYEQGLPGASFLDYFWSWRALMGGWFQMLLAPLPQARVYHCISTGYAGLLGARARIETGRTAFLTEHGIYTNERRIEIAMADWLHERAPTGFSLQRASRDLRDFWIDAFCAYARVCYQAMDPIVTLYTDNKIMQRRDGAPEAALRIIPNGVDYERFSSIEPKQSGAPTIALIGRVVPIKDVKTYIRAAGILKRQFPDLTAYVMGPTEEDPVYAGECKTLAKHLGLEDTVQFTGSVKLDDYLGKLDVLALTSLSEAQPLVVLEAGAAGVPSVTTDVGCCRDLIFGQSGEEPPLGGGGGVTPGADPEATAIALAAILGDPKRKQAMGEAMQARVRKTYNKPDIMAIYGELYRGLTAMPTQPVLAPQAEAA
ncbi:MAG: GT4 family glycosyltransferase PelF [Alphaproteobacteria bacterium]